MAEVSHARSGLLSTNENSSHVVLLAEKYVYEGVKQSHSEHYLRKYQAREKPGFTRLKGRERPEGMSTVECWILSGLMLVRIMYIMLNAICELIASCPLSIPHH